MAYLQENNPRVNEDIISRKEFYQYYLPNDTHQVSDLESAIIPRFPIKQLITKENYLQFHSYQLFISNFINPNTPYSRLLMKWQTGSGKTIGSLAVAMQFIKYYRDEELHGSASIGSVFVLGFAAHVFQKELLEFPEFGIISREALIKLKKLRSIAHSGAVFDIDRYREYLMRIKKKFNNRKGNGFFRFIGYKKLVNMVFHMADDSINISDLDEEGIGKAIESGKIKLNIPLLNEFKNSILICDEIHNVYNSLDKNNWGVALQYVLNYHPSVRALFMSATPINNNPTEIIDLLNLLLPEHLYGKLYKKDFFSDKQLKQGALEKIATLCKGRISFLRDSNPMYFPTKKFIGEKIYGAPYLKFIRCPMSKFHYNTYKAVYTGSLSPESQYLVDFALPNPEDENIGMYQTSVVKKMLSYAGQKWKDANKINFQRGKIVGDILRLENLPKISSKYARMMEIVNDIIKNQRGKMFIYHNVVHMSGVLFIQEIMLQNYIIGEYDSSTSNTLCAVCGKMRKCHNENKTGGFPHGENKQISVNISNVSDELYYVKHDGKKLSLKYNYTFNSYEVYAGEYGAPLLEFIVVDDIMVVRGSMTIINKCMQIIKILCNSGDVIVRMSESHQILDKLKMSVFEKNDILYYTNMNLKLLKSRIKDVIKGIDEHINLARKKTRGRKNKAGGSGGKVGNKPEHHSFVPVRFMAVHNELGKPAINSSLIKYNSPDNIYGFRLMILIGGKLIKESYDIKAVREMMIMGRPDNIPTLIQILGRAVRKGSHKLLPPDKRHVNIRIFTTCLPIKEKNGLGDMEYGLGYEEMKYVEKLQHYKVIQNIEKIMHENAIDAYMNRDIIWTKKERRLYQSNKEHAELGALYFTPTISKYMNKSFRPDELNLQTFNAFYKNKMVDNIIIIIKRLFLERSAIWKYNDLYKMVLNSRSFMQVEFNTKLINEESFVIALSRLVWSDDAEYVEPAINTKLSNSMIGINKVINKLFDPTDKIIILSGNQRSVITQVGEYYMLFPIDDVSNEPMRIVELPYRIMHVKDSVDVYIRTFLETGQTLSNYVDKRDRFFTRWNNVSIENLELAVCDFGTDFHVAFLEECIEYIFNVWTDPNLKKSFMHTFYFKMLNYYDLRRLVIWGHTLKPFIFSKYKSYIRQIDVKLKQGKTIKIENKLKELDNKEKNLSTSGLINFLKSSINKSDLHWVSSGLKKQFEENLDKSLKLFDGNYKKDTGKKKCVNADLTPVGHFLSNIPKFYHPKDGWFESPEYLTEDHTYVENDVIIGYDERSKTGVHIRFKIRTPIQNIKQYRDSRMIERGSVCAYKSKTYMKSIAQKIGIRFKPGEKLNVSTLCNSIRTKLIYLELKERLANTKKKWFYFIYEKRPETMTE